MVFLGAMPRSFFSLRNVQFLFVTQFDSAISSAEIFKVILPALLARLAESPKNDTPPPPQELPFLLQDMYADWREDQFISWTIKIQDKENTSSQPGWR
jgi:hypothetical protein